MAGVAAAASVLNVVWKDMVYYVQQFLDEMGWKKNSRYARAFSILTSFLTPVLDCFRRPCLRSTMTQTRINSLLILSL